MAQSIGPRITGADLPNLFSSGERWGLLCFLFVFCFGEPGSFSLRARELDRSGRRMFRIKLDAAKVA